MKASMMARLSGALWALAWMWPLIGSVITIADGSVPRPALAGLGLAAFVVLYLILVTNGFDESRPRRTALDTTMLLVCAALGLTLLWAYGLYNQWANIILYVAVAGAVVLRNATAIAWVVGSCVVFLVYCTVGPARHAGPGEWATLSFGILLASALVFTIKRMMTYIDQLGSTRAKLAETAVSEERLRFSRDLHDLLGHTMSLIVVKA
ncbi:MAG TPA: histidine kinase, partial [Micromonosporaceae bacterium]